MPPSTLFPPNAGVIFDMDGLMLDTERIARIAWQEAALLFGHRMSDELFASLIGRTHPESIALVRAAFGPSCVIACATSRVSKSDSAPRTKSVLQVMAW